MTFLSKNCLIIKQNQDSNFTKLNYNDGLEGKRVNFSTKKAVQLIRFHIYLFLAKLVRIYLILVFVHRLTLDSQALEERAIVHHLR